MEKLLKQFDLVPLDFFMIVLCAFVFIAFWRMLDKSVFTPHQKLLDDRRLRTAGAEGRAEELRVQARQLLDNYERDISTVRYEAIRGRQEVIAAAQQQSTKIISAAEAEAEEVLRKARWDMQHRLSEIRQNISEEAASLAKMVVEKLRQPPLLAESNKRNSDMLQ